MVTFNINELNRIESGASKKKIYRFKNKNTKNILVDFSYSFSDYLSFINVHQYLSNINISIPKIFDTNDTEKLILMEDFGNDRYDKIITNYNVKQLLVNAIDSIIAIQQFDKPLLEDGFKTVAGVFSADAADSASELLLSVLPRLTGTVADLGAGWGYLTRNLIEMPTQRVIAVEADYRAIEIARVNVHSDKVKFVWADATSWRADQALDTVVMNPPFHNFGKADTGIGIDFIKAAVRSLKPQGDCYIVANRHLPYEQPLNELFQNVSEVTKDNRFKVLYASKPKRNAGI